MIDERATGHNNYYTGRKVRYAIYGCTLERVYVDHNAKDQAIKDATEPEYRRFY